MEFLQALEKSQILGLTKEEFLSAWKTESELKKIKYERRERKLRTSHTENIKQVEQDLEQAFNLKLEHLSKQLIEKMEHLLQQMHLKFDLLHSEFLSHFEILNHLITDTVGSQTSFLKIYISHENELIKQELKKLNDDLRVIAEAGLNLSKQTALVTSKYSASCFQQSTDCSSQQEIKCNMINKENQLKQTGGKSVPQDFYENEHKLQQHQSDISHLDTGSCVDNQSNNAACNEHSVKGKLVSEMSQNLSFKSYAVIAASPACTDKCPLTDTRMYGLLINTSTDSPSNSALSQPSEEDSFATASLFTRKINTAPPPSSDFDISSLKMPKKQPQEVTSDNKPCMSICYPKLSEFTISIKDVMNISDELFFSPYEYSRGNACRVRMNVKFEISGHLSVDVHVARGDFDDSHKWPLRLTGDGYICHIGSRCYSPLWHIFPVSCPQPQSAVEQTFPATIHMTTKKCRNINVTYKGLVARNYAENNRIKLKWDLRAYESNFTLASESK